VPSGRGTARVQVKIPDQVWEQEVERLRADSPGRIAAERERRRLERDGLPRDELLRCEAVGEDGTRLPGLFKVYVPISEEATSGRPFGFVFSPGVEDGRPHLTLVAYGERHPPRGTRAVYERAHKHLHGRFPDQERGRPEAADRSPRVQSASGGLQRSRERGGLER
jgi:hypothetical protein